MILFQKDWKAFPTSIVDTQTKNTSFLKLAAIYKKMGIKNNAFHLSLLQPALQGVDPHDPSLSQELREMVITECKFNIWYFLREVLKIPQQGSPVPSPFLINRSNVAMMWCFMNGVDYANILPRQQGKSVGADSLNIWIINVAAYDTTVQLLTKDAKLRKGNIERLKKIRELLPDYINLTTKDDADNTEEYTCIRLLNYYKTAVGQKSEDLAENVGRGLTGPITQVDEGPYVPNIHIAMPVMLASSTNARDIAKANNTLFGNIITTTAGRRDTNEGKYMYKLIHDGARWNERFLDLPDYKGLCEAILTNAHGERLLINGTFSHRQLGKTDKWLKDAIINANAGKDMASRDFLNMWTNGAERSPLDKEIIDVLSGFCGDPKYTELCGNNYLLRWYIPAERIDEIMSSGHFIISLDTGNTVGKDANGLTIIDIKTMEVIAAADITDANIYRFSEWIAELLLKYLRLTLVIENKSTGMAIADAVAVILIKHGHNPFVRMFNRIIQNPDEHKVANKEMEVNKGVASEDFYMRYRKYIGFMTTGSSRRLLYETLLHSACRSTAHRVNDNVLSEQLRSLVERNGRVDHPVGGHDDLVIAWLMGHYFASHGRNHEFYGLPRGIAMSLTSAEGAIVSEEEQTFRQENAKNKLLLEDFKTRLSSAKGQVERYKLEQQIRKVHALIPQDEVGSTINAILEDCRNTHKSKNTLREKLSRMTKLRR